MKIKVAVIAVVLLLAASSLGLAVETWTSGWTQNKVTATIHYVDITGKKISRNFIGTYNDFEIDRDARNHHYIWLYSTNEFGNHSGMKITVNAVGSGLPSPSGATAFLATNGDPNLNKFANTSSFPLTLQLTPSIYMDPADVKSLLIKGAYTVNNLVGSSSPTLHLYATGTLTVYGNKYPGFITLSTGQRNLPATPGVYNNISSTMTPKQPSALNSGSVVAKDLNYSISFGNNSTFNVIADSGANSGGSTAGLQVTIVGNPLDGTATPVPPANQKVTYAPKAGFSGVDDMYYVVSTGPNAVSPKYQITVNVGPAPVAQNAAPSGMPSQLQAVNDGGKLMVEKNSTTPLTISLGNYLLNWNNNLTFQIGANVKGIVSKTGQTHSDPTQQNYQVGYTPNPNFSGVDYFTYWVTESIQGTTWSSIPGTISVLVVPNAFDDESTIHSRTQSAFGMNLLANDETFGNAKIFHVYSSVRGATITLINSSSVTSPNINYYTNTAFANNTGTDTFAYTMEDSSGQTSTASVTIHLAQ